MQTDNVRRLMACPLLDRTSRWRTEQFTEAPVRADGDRCAYRDGHQRGSIEAYPTPGNSGDLKALSGTRTAPDVQACTLVNAQLVGRQIRGKLDIVGSCRADGPAHPVALGQRNGQGSLLPSDKVKAHITHWIAEVRVRAANRQTAKENLERATAGGVHKSVAQMAGTWTKSISGHSDSRPGTVTKDNPPRIRQLIPHISPFDTHALLRNQNPLADPQPVCLG